MCIAIARSTIRNRIDNDARSYILTLDRPASMLQNYSLEKKIDEARAPVESQLVSITLLDRPASDGGGERSTEKYESRKTTSSPRLSSVDGCDRERPEVGQTTVDR